MIEHFFQCPYCWKEISMLVDPSVNKQTYIEDCEVCCNPMKLTVVFKHQQLAEFGVEQID